MYRIDDVDVIKSGNLASSIVPPLILAPSVRLVAVVAVPSNVVAVIIPPCAVIPVPTLSEFVTITSSGNPICGWTFSPDVTDTVTSFVVPEIDWTKSPVVSVARATEFACIVAAPEALITTSPLTFENV